MSARRVRLSVLVVVVLAAAFVSVAHAAGHRLPLLETDFGAPQVRPHTIGFTGDGTGIIGKLPSDLPAVGKRPGYLHWIVYTRTHAVGYGTLWAKNCIPDCAASSFRRVPAKVTAGRVRAGHYTRLTLYYRYRGQNVVDRRCMRPPYYEGYGLVIRGRCE